MTQHIDLLNDFLQRVEDSKNRTNERTVFSSNELMELVKNYPGIPNDYVEFLAKIGCGSFREGTYVVYSGLVAVNEILPGFESDYKILCFGDDLRGDPAGFIPSQDWKVVEIFHEDYDVHCEDQTFSEFIAERLYMSKNGNDISQKTPS